MKSLSILRASIMIVASVIVVVSPVRAQTGEPSFVFEPDSLPVAFHPDSLPVTVADSVVKPLRTLVDDDLQAELERIVAAKKKWVRLVKDDRMGIGLVDMRNPLDVKFARVNGNNMMYAASLPKIAILLAAMDAIEKGELTETGKVDADMRLMISRSDNAASTRMIDRLGYEKIASVLQDPRYELYDEEYGGGLWVGKRYAKTGARYPDPLEGLSHAATATQVCRYYYLLTYGRLVSFERSKQMLGILTDPALHHKFVNTLDDVAPSAQLFRKSGSWRTYHSDSVLVWGPVWRRYILVALIDDPDGENILRQLMLEVDRMLKPS